jgi:lambda repressor-like predicted transcriptional regulator
LSGLDNHKADLRSRIEEKGITMGQIMSQNGHDYAPIINLRENVTTDTLFRMCDPRVKIDEEK